jgi:subtilase family serine protease
MAAEFADRFALSAADAGAVAAWLQSEGFTVAPLPVSRGWIEFSGTAGQLQQAFGAAVMRVGPTSYALRGKVVLPALLAGKIEGLVSLDGSVAMAAATAPVEVKSSVAALAAASSAASTGLAPALTPALAASWLELDSAKVGTGAGVTIVVRRIWRLSAAALGCLRPA